MFQAGAAALNKHGLLQPGSEIGHAWLQSTFSGMLIHRRKIFSGKFKSYLPDAYWVRIAADYKTELVSKKVASRELKKADEFINTIKADLSYEAQS